MHMSNFIIVHCRWDTFKSQSPYVSAIELCTFIITNKSALYSFMESMKYSIS